MQEKFYSVEEIAQMLDMHPKTIARYIREGHIRAQKFGKAWRVSGHDLSVFIEGSKQTDAAQLDRATGVQDVLERAMETMRVSAVTDIPVRDQEEASLIMNWLTATVHSDRSAHTEQSMTAQYIAETGVLRVNLWGGIGFVGAVLSSLSLQ